MLNADQAPYFDVCPRCGEGGLETLKTHAFCVNCNYEEIYDDELCVIPRWALSAVKEASKPVSQEQRQPAEYPSTVVLRKPAGTKPDGSAA